jgi:hypothetical protein
LSRSSDSGQCANGKALYKYPTHPWFHVNNCCFLAWAQGGSFSRIYRLSIHGFHGLTQKPCPTSCHRRLNLQIAPRTQPFACRPLNIFSRAHPSPTRRISVTVLNSSVTSVAGDFGHCVKD